MEALLAARASQGLYKNLQSQLVRLFAWAQESTQYITRLRQIQNDYALLNSMNTASNPSQGLALERYGQGYTTINRLLETSLRLSELGAEAEKTVLQTADSLQSLDRNIIRLQQTIEDSRLVPFKNLSFRARAILRDLTNRYARPAQLVVQGEQIELDVGTVSKLEPALLHLLRNAYDHGIEPPAERSALGKPEQGMIALSLRRRGNSFELSLQDDGRGIDAEAIQKIAQAKGLPFTHTQTPAELLSVLCQPGFSSKSTVSDLSGRGVGMDVVADQVASLRGKLSLDTIPGAGTTFHLQIPVPHLLMSCVLLKAGDRTFAIPNEDIITTNLLGNLNVTQTADPSYVYSWVIQEAAGVVPGLDLLEYWQARSTLRPLSDTAVCVYIRSTHTQKGAWLIADDLLGQTELLVNPLPSPMVSPAGLMGVSLQIDGTLIPILEVATLAEYLLTPTAAPVESTVGAPTAVQTDTSVHFGKLEPGVEYGSLKQNILVVDDQPSPDDHRY